MCVGRPTLMSGLLPFVHGECWRQPHQERLIQHRLNVSKSFWKTGELKIVRTGRASRRFLVYRRLSVPLPSNRHHRSSGDCLEGNGEKLSGLFCAILCATIVHSVMHTHMNRPNSSLDLVLSHCAHFTVLRFILCMYVFSVWLYIACMCSIITWWGGPGGIEAYPEDYYFLQCFDAVGWVIWPVKTRPRYDL